MAKLDELKALAADLRKRLRQVDRLTGRTSERDRDTRRKRDLRATAKEVQVPLCDDPHRRARLESDDTEWLRYYFHELFWYPFTTQQLEMIEAIRNAIRYGGDQAIAASRGEGKTKLFERTLLKYTLAGVIKFSVLFAATGSAAQDSLQSIMGEIETNERLRADYPEACIPVLALENTPNRAHYQLVTGKRHDNGEPYQSVPSRFSWCGQEIVLPNVPGSPSAGAIIATRGLDAAVRGLNKRNRRVDVAGIDDPDTEETVNSEEQAKKLERRIDRAIAGLGGQQRTVARVMLTTIQNRTCVSFKFTDPAQKPTWKGKRFRFLIKKPERSEPWDEYVQLRQAHPEDEFGRIAHAFYVENRAAMDAGAEVANPNRFDPQELPDGTQLEVSALQRYYNEVARIGPEAVASEYDNDPPEEAGPIESGITPHRIQKQLSGYARKTVPPECTVLTQGIDVRKVALHWVVRAWRPDGTGFTIDYGVHEIHGTKYGSDDGLDVAVKRAILARLEATKETEYVTNAGQRMAINLTLVDAGWRTAAVYSACAQAGLGVMPVMGFGKSAGCTQANFSDVQRRTLDKKPGDRWFLSRKGRLWLVCADTDHWKAWEHDRWMTAPGKPGCLTLFGQANDKPDRLSADEKAHHSYARHICNEVEIEEPYQDTIRRRWKAKSENTHWLDASYYSDVAANMKGIRLVGPAVAKPTQSIPSSSPAVADGGRKRMSLGQLATAARGQ
jgi:hypothetical protein